ncbi:MAG: hypothetical protein OEZ47_04810 [Gammaproteobacteria bacterium]|nr:hypothetical protein [Gammaproteobacteria bacterium]
MQDMQEKETMDVNSLYREDTFTDRAAGTIRRLTPVTPEGSEDASRATIYIGQAQMLTPMGAIPLNFEISARSLKEAVENFADEVEHAAQEALDELREMQRDAASQIVVPGQSNRIQLP